MSNILANLIGMGTLGLVDGGEAVGGLRRALGLESEQTALARLAAKAKLDLEAEQSKMAAEQLRTQASAMRNRGLIDGLIGSGQDLAMAQAGTPLVLAPDSPEIQNLNSAKNAYDAIQAQYRDAVAADPYLAQARDLIERDNLETAGTEAEIRAKDAKARSTLYDIQSREADAFEKRRQQGALIAERSGGMRGAELLGLDPSASPESVLAAASAVREGMPAEESRIAALDSYAQATFGKNFRELGMADRNRVFKAYQSDKLKNAQAVGGVRPGEAPKTESAGMYTSAGDRETDPVGHRVQRLAADSTIPDQQKSLSRQALGWARLAEKNIQELNQMIDETQGMWSSSITGSEAAWALAKNAIGSGPTEILRSALGSKPNPREIMIGIWRSRVKELVGDAVSGADWDNVFDALPQPGSSPEKVAQAMGEFRRRVAEKLKKEGKAEVQNLFATHPPSDLSRSFPGIFGSRGSGKKPKVSPDEARRKLNALLKSKGAQR